MLHRLTFTGSAAINDQVQFFLIFYSFPLAAELPYMLMVALNKPCHPPLIIVGSLSGRTCSVFTMCWNSRAAT